MSMANEYERDYGYIGRGSVNNTPSASSRKTLVYLVTHRGNDYLPYMERSFISFSYGKKNIEEFNLIATISGDRLSRDGYASFEDITSSYNTLDGLQHWGTHYTTNNLELVLSTDGMTLRLLDDFLVWFSPGVSKELILAEHPNRAIMARISEVPKLELLPFEEKIVAKIGGYDYNTSTTMYKGDIEISFVMDDPFWYSKINIFGHGGANGIYYDTWTDANGKTVSIYDDPDAIKIAVEDGIPISSMLSVSLLLGDNTFANMDDESNGMIAMDTATVTLDRDTSDDHIIFTVYKANNLIDSILTLYNTTGNRISDIFKWRVIAFTQLTNYVVNSNDTADLIYQKLISLSRELVPVEHEDHTYVYTKENVADINPRSVIAEINSQTNEYVSGAKIAGPHMDSTTGIPSLTRAEKGYFYYAGTAPALPLLEFKLIPTMSNYYINLPKNTYSTLNNPYNIITIESVNKLEFKFTTPNIYTSYNLTIAIFGEMITGESWETIREKIRANVNHFEVRKWAMRVIDSLDTNNGIINASSTEAKIRMSYMFKNKTDTDEFLEAQFSFDSKTGSTTGQIKCRTFSSEDTKNTDRTWWRDTAGSIVILEEDVGDMVRSNFLVIKDRNYPDDTGHILAREDNRADTYQYSHVLYHDVDGIGLLNVFIKYKNMYL